MKLHALLFGSSCGAALLAQGPVAPAAPPRLVVLCAVDQLAAWVFDRALPHLPADGGFARLCAGGVQFANCAYQHACTETGPGHATIGTGAPAAHHGIVRNNWWSVPDQRELYCVEEPVPALPELPEGKDRGPGRLMLPTLGDGLKAHWPGAKVASVSWKDRSAILMAGGSADCVVWIETKTGNLVTNTRWAKAVPEWVAAWNQRRPIDALFGTVWQRSGPDAAYAGLVDDRPFETPHASDGKSRTLPQPLTGGIAAPGKEFFTQVYASPFGNTLVRQAAEACLDALQLGADDVPDLLCVSFSSTDAVGHAFGPDSVEARDTLLRLDSDLAALLGTLDQKVGAGRYALFLTADHGIVPVPEASRAAGVDAGRGALQTAARAAAEQALGRQFGPPPEGKRYVPFAGDFALFLDHELLLQKAEPNAQVLRAAARLAAAAALRVRGMQTTCATLDLFEPGTLPEPLQRSLQLAYFPGRAGDVQLVLKPYWLDGTTPASHGSPHPYDREVVAFAFGGGARVGARCQAAVTPGLGALWLARQCGLPAPPGAVDTLPAELLAER
jgi:hypothetical protein